MAYQGGNLKSTSINGVTMYTVSSNQRSIATWLPPKKVMALRKDQSYRARLDLIQDLRFETATSKIKVTPDGEFIIASGIYPPQVKVYEVRQLSLKFERHLISEIIDFRILADDYSKIAFLCADRSVCLHAKYGSHYSLRIPRAGRDIAYDCSSCDLLAAASSPDLYRINLEQGRFLSPLATKSPALNVVCRSKLHGLVACGGEDGAVECFDMRTKSTIGRIDAVLPAGDNEQEVTALEFDGDGGFHMAVGSSAGKVLIYDLRSSHPLRVKDHMYGSPILDIKWHHTLNSQKRKLVTTDSHVVRIWDPETGDGLTSIEPTAGKINDTCIFNESGLMLLALDCSQIPSYFIPALGPAPKWCSYLQNITEEMEENAQTTIYDDYKFLTKEDLQKLNLTNLIGTNLLRAYMHGYFIDYRLYKKAQSLANPFSYDEYIERCKKEKLEKQRASRITILKKLPKANRKLAAHLLVNEEAELESNDAETKNVSKSKKKKNGLDISILKDDRFAAMFENKDFEIDEQSQEYVALHPMSSEKPQVSLLEEHFEPVIEVGQSGSDADTSDGAQSSDERESHETKRRTQPRLYEVKDERHAEAFWRGVSLAGKDRLSMEERVAMLEREQKRSDMKVGLGGSREISFTARGSGKRKEDIDLDERPKEKRRGIQCLGLKSTSFQGRGGGRMRGRGSGRGRGRRRR